MHIALKYYILVILDHERIDGNDGATIMTIERKFYEMVTPKKVKRLQTVINRLWREKLVFRKKTSGFFLYNITPSGVDILEDFREEASLLIK